MTMKFSAYQIESMLDDYQQEKFPSDRSTSETLNLSEEAINEARQHFTPSENRILVWKSPIEGIELIEDKTTYNLVVDYVQQSRAGRFVDPVYVPENPPPAFSLVTDYSKHDRKDSEEEQEAQESGTARVKDKVSVNEAETEKNLSHSDQINISITEKDTDSNSEKISETDIVEAADEESIPEKLGEDTKRSNKANKKIPTDSAAKLFENIEDDEVDEEFEFDEKGLCDEDDVDNDVVFGDGQIDSKSINRFVKNFPDSAIKFMFRKNLDGRNLPVEYEEIYINWEKRGLSRGRLKKYLFKMMKWDNFPDIPILEVVQRIKDRQYDLKGKK